jgi:hypothetical protein
MARYWARRQSSRRRAINVKVAALLKCRFYIEEMSEPLERRFSVNTIGMVADWQLDLRDLQQSIR